MRWLRGGFIVVVVVVILAVQWLHIDDLRQRVSELEQIYQSASTNKHPLTPFNNDHPSLYNEQRFTAEV